MENQKLTLFQKLLEIQKQIIGLGKDGKSFGYNFVTGSKALEHIKPLMNKYGILLKQEILTISNVRQDYQTKNGAKSEILTMTTQKFTWVDVDSGEKDENLFAANGQNDWEKGLGSALTYAERYFLLKYFHISTDEDDIDNPMRDANKKDSSPLAKSTTANLENYPAPAPNKLQTTPVETQKQWINENTKQFDEALKFIKDGGNIQKIRLKYAIHPKVAAKLEELASMQS